MIVHEIAHGWMALRLGDSTAYDAGRLTFNPIPHIDIIGSIAVPLLSIISTGSVFIAWAKPVPVNPANFKNPRKDEVLVSVVGPLSNFIVALVCTVFYIILANLSQLLLTTDFELQKKFFLFLIQMFLAGITLNIFLAVFNLMPVPPLDGSHVVSSLLPAPIAERYNQIGFFGIIIIIFLMRLEPIRKIIITIVLTLKIPYDFLIMIFS